MIWNVFIYISIIVICECIAQFFIKQSIIPEGCSLKYIILSCCFYSVIVYMLHLSYKEYPLSKINVIWSCFTIIFSIILGHTIYNETINFKLILAVMSSMCSIWLVYIS